MNLKILYIYNSIKLFEILNEIKTNLNFEVYHIDKNKYKKEDFINLKNFLIITTNSNDIFDNSLMVENFPISLSKLVEKINLSFLSNQFSVQSKLNIGKYILDLNSRTISYGDISLDLTEKECNLIFFININKKVRLRELQKEVWGYISDLETHTVETHIYRLRKKVLNSFKDNDFIKHDSKGYFLN